MRGNLRGRKVEEPGRGSEMLQMEALSEATAVNSRDLGEVLVGNRGYYSCFCFEDGAIFKNSKHFQEPGASAT
jgi:hypothetical protein